MLINNFLQLKTDFLVLNLFIIARFWRTLEARLVHIFPQISSSFDIFGVYARRLILPKFLAFQLMLPNSFSLNPFFLDLHMKVEFLVTEVIICTTMSNCQLQKIFRFVSSGLISFFWNMLRLYACCGFSVPALCNTDDRRHNIDDFFWGSNDSWCAFEGIGVSVSYCLANISYSYKRIVSKNYLYTHSVVVTVFVIASFLLQLCLDTCLPYISVVNLL